MKSSFYSQIGKRWFDATVSVVGLLFLGPLLFLVAALVRLTSPGPALFSQVRVGRFEKPFRIFKFRTMRASPGGAQPGSLLTAAGDSRITPLGRLLRKTKIDEFPQLFNVLAGHMSLVGPRPEVPRFTASYSNSDREVFEVRPGITGPSIILNEEQLMAQQTHKERFYVEVILPAKLGIDLQYCSEITFAGDLRVLFLTLGRLFYRPASRAISEQAIEHLAAVSKLTRQL